MQLRGTNYLSRSDIYRCGEAEFHEEDKMINSSKDSSDIKRQSRIAQRVKDLLLESPAIVLKPASRYFVKSTILKGLKY
jgi:hypothetical protein